MKLLPIGLAAVLCLSAATASAHEFIVKPAATSVAQGTALPVTIMMTETYMVPDRLPPETTRLHVVAGGAAVEVPVAADAAARVVRASVTAPVASSFLLAAHSVSDRAPAAQGPMKGKSRRIETFSKALINAGAGGDAATTPLGTRLEVVATGGPETMKAGAELRVRILFDGQPVAARVQATYDGKSDKPHGYPVRAESGADGVVRIPLSGPGLWIVRTKHVLETTGGVDVHELSANLVFAVE